MMNLAEYRRRSQSLADFLPWAALVREGVVLNKDGSFQRTAKFRGPDLDSSTPAELVAITSRLNNALRRLGTGWAIFIEAQRQPAHSYPLNDFPEPASKLVDAERRAQFEEEGAHFESRYFLTLLWLPPADDSARAEAWLYENRAHDGADWRAALDGFVDRTDRVLALVEGFMPEAEWLDDGETLTYLHSCVSTRRQRVRVPETPIYLDAILVDEDLTGGLEPRLGRAHLRTLTIMGFPSQTWPGLLDDLNRLAFPYRWATRAICLDKTDATRLLGKIRRQWFAKRKSIMAILKEVMTNEASVLMDSDAANKALDADAALQELGSDLVGEAYVTATVTVWHDDPRMAEDRLRLVEKAIQGRDFTCMRETVNAIESWLGSLPGHVYANVRQPPISTLNLAHMMPFSAVWAGPERDEHLQAPPLFFARTEGSTPFRFSLHVGDVGHTLIVGPTGAGKSVLLALMALQFRRYPGAQVFAFDFGGSIRAAALAMGGDWHDLGGALAEDVAEPVSLQPLARLDDAGERAWAAEWVAALLAREAVAITPELKEHLWSALTSLASAPLPERTITGLSVLLQSNALKQALQPYTVGGPWGRLLDAETERLGEADVQAFETEGLIGAGAAPAVLSYLFHRIGDRLDGRPTLLIIDEGWLALDDRGFAEQLREWLKTLRKKNASVIFATQSLADIDGSAIATSIIESCPTRLFLPNERALEPQIAAIYRRFGLNDRQIEILSRSTPKRDYYCQSRRGNRLFELGLSEVALAFTAASSKSDQKAIAEIVAAQAREGFAAAWLRAQGPRLGGGHARHANSGDRPMNRLRLRSALRGRRRRAYPRHRERARPCAMDRLRSHQLCAERADRGARAAAGQQRDPEPAKPGDVTHQPGQEPREPALFLTHPAPAVDQPDRATPHPGAADRLQRHRRQSGVHPDLSAGLFEFDLLAAAAGGRSNPLAERARRVPGRHARASRRGAEPLHHPHPDRRARLFEPRGIRRAPGRAIRQPACRSSDHAARRPHRGDGGDRARPEPGGRAQCRKPSPGAAAADQFLELRAGLPAGRRADVPLMRADPLNFGAWARALGLVAVTIAMIMASVHFRDNDSGIVAAAKLGFPPHETDPLADELARCRAIGMAAIEDAACKAAWAENRRRFFAAGSTADHTTAPTAAA